MRASEKQFQDLVDASPAMIWITDAESRCIYLSRQWYEYTGRTPEQDLGFGWLENIHPDDLAGTSQVYSQAVTNKGSLTTDYRLRRKDGAYRWSVDVGYPRFDAEGRFLGYIGTVTDIHERLVVEHELKNTQRRIERSAQATDLGIWYCDLPFDELSWNKEVKNHFWLPPDARVTIETFYERIHPDDREMTRQAIALSNEQKKAYDIVYRTTNPADPNQFKYIRAVGWTDFDAKGTPIRFDGITLDVTQEIRAQEELRLAKDQAEAASQAKSAFLANMSHEIRTPLGAILGFADLLRDDHLNAEERKMYLDTIERNGKALTRIIDDILDLAKVESGRIHIENTEFSFFDLISEVVILFQEHAKKKGISLKLNYPAPVPPRLISDAARLRQILINIIGNAVKFTHVGGVTISVSTEPLADDQIMLSVAVKDTGIGISAEQRQRLFQPFSQADDTTTRRYGGTGLGLVLSHRLAAALGGTININDCETDQGCTFVVSFAATVVTKLSNGPRAGAEAPAHDPRRFVNKNILVADDSADNRLLLEMILKRNGAEVICVADGRQALNLASNQKFDLILMDVQMPEMDGYEAVRALRQAGCKIPIIALTAHAMHEERVRSKAAGCDAHLTKPLDQQALFETVKNLLN